MSPGGLFSAGTAVSLAVGDELVVTDDADVVGIGVGADALGRAPLLAPFPHPPRTIRPTTATNDFFMVDDAREGAASGTPTPG
jgi:hypothetical protein